MNASRSLTATIQTQPSSRALMIPLEMALIKTVTARTAAALEAAVVRAVPAQLELAVRVVPAQRAVPVVPAQLAVPAEPAALVGRTSDYFHRIVPTQRVNRP